MIPFVILSIEDEEDRAFMTEVYLQYERLLWSTILKVLKGQGDPEEVLQNLLVKLVRKVKLLRSMETRNMVNYIITSAENASKDALRALGKAEMPSMDDEEWIGRVWIKGPDDVEDTVSRRETVQKLEEIWPLLDERSRYLLEGKYFQGLTTYEMGAALGIKHDSVRVELSRARRKAKALLEKHFSMTGSI